MNTWFLEYCRWYQTVLNNFGRAKKGMSMSDSIIDQDIQMPIYQKEAYESNQSYHEEKRDYPNFV